MDKRLRLLLVEDSEEDEALILLVLRRAGYAVEHTRVASLAALAAQPRRWDLVICDYYLPGMSGADVLRWLMAQPLPPPVIIVSGRTGEPLAVEMIQAGASDYILKDNLARLPIAVERGIRENLARVAKHRAEVQVARLNRVYQLLSAINKAIYRTADPQALAQEVCGIATRFGQYSFVRIVQEREGQVVTSAASRSSQLDRLQDPPFGLEKRAMATGQTLIETDAATVPQPYQACAILPLKVEGRWWGCLSFYALGKDVFNHEEMTLLQELSHDLAWALESRLLEQRRRETDQFLQDMTNLVPGLFYKQRLAADGTWQFVYVSPGIDLFLPHTPEAVLADAGLFLGAIHPDDRPRYDEFLERSARNLTVFSLEFRLVRPNGTVVWTLATSFPQKLFDDSIVWTGLAIDVTPQNRLQEALQREQELLSVTLENIGDGMIAIGEEAQVVLINRAALALLGWSDRDTVGKHWSQLPLRLPWEARDTLTPWQVALPDGRDLHLETHVSDLKDRDGDIRGRVMLLRDVTQREKIEERLRQSEKLESVGLLAGGIAHDFNNLLTGVFGFLQLARMNAADEHLVVQYVDQALGPFERARGLTRQLLTFAKGGQLERAPLQVRPTLATTLEFQLGGTAIDWKLETLGEPWPVVANEGQIGQVFENLILNARQVLEGRGAIVVTLANAEHLERADLHLPLGDYVVVEVADNGPGIPADVLPRIFDPFFTTKTTGTGLGLSICFSVVKKHGGALEVDSAPGRGTVFRVYLPASVAR